MNAAFDMTLPDGEVVTLGVSRLPGRIRPALYAQEGNRRTALAYFRDLAAAERAEVLLRLLAKSLLVSDG